MFDGVLGITILPWPTVGHEVVVHRAINRVPPFNTKGGGYRDTLIWFDALSLVQKYQDVVLVSMDGAFKEPDGELRRVLIDEAEAAGGHVELARSFGAWIAHNSPWASAGEIVDVLAAAQEAEFFDYFLKSDLESDIEPSTEDVGFSVSPLEVDLNWWWEGEFERESMVRTASGVSTTYRLGYSIQFTAVIPKILDKGEEWAQRTEWRPGLVDLEGVVSMFVIVTVVYGDEFGMDIENIEWRRADGTSSGASIYDPYLDPNQPELF